MLKLWEHKIAIYILYIWFLWLQSNIEVCESAVTLSTSSPKGDEGDDVSFTVTWTDEELITVKIESTALPESERYSTTCSISPSTQLCGSCATVKNSNIGGTCPSAKTITWTVSSLEIRNQGSHLISLTETNGNPPIEKTLTYDVKAPPKDASLSCTHSNNCDNTVTCTCTAKSGNPKPTTVSWHVKRTGGSTKDLTSGFTPSNFDIFEDISSTLQYTKVADDAGGELVCEVGNSEGTIDAKENVNYKDPATCTTTVTVSTVSTDAETVTRDYRLSDGAIAGIVISCVVVAGIIVGVSIYAKMKCCKKKKKQNDLSINKTNDEPVTETPTHSNVQMVEQKMKLTPTQPTAIQVNPALTQTQNNPDSSSSISNSEPDNKTYSCSSLPRETTSETQSNKQESTSQTKPSTPKYKISN